MEEILQKFNLFMEEMADAVASAKNPKQAEKIQAEYDVKIIEVEKQLEKQLEDFVSNENAALQAEEDAFTKALSEPDPNAPSDKPADPEEEPEDPKPNELVIRWNFAVSELSQKHEGGKLNSELKKIFDENELIELGKSIGEAWSKAGPKSKKIDELLKQSPL